MRKRTAALALCLALAACALWCALHAAPPASPATDLAGLGLVLLEGEDGVSVLAVLEKSLAARAGVRPGDKLLSAAGETLTTTVQLRRLAFGGERAALPLTVRRQSQVLRLLLELQ